MICAFTELTLESHGLCGGDLEIERGGQKWGKSAGV